VGCVLGWGGGGGGGVGGFVSGGVGCGCGGVGWFVVWGVGVLVGVENIVGGCGVVGGVRGGDTRASSFGRRVLFVVVMGCGGGVLLQVCLCCGVVVGGCGVFVECCFGVCWVVVVLENVGRGFCGVVVGGGVSSVGGVLGGGGGVLECFFVGGWLCFGGFFVWWVWVFFGGLGGGF